MMMSAVGAVGARVQMELCDVGIICHARGVFDTCVFFLELDVGW
jgi:hypothetical protein